MEFYLNLQHKLNFLMILLLQKLLVTKLRVLATSGKSGQKPPHPFDIFQFPTTRRPPHDFVVDQVWFFHSSFLVRRKFLPLVTSLASFGFFCPRRLRRLVLTVENRMEGLGLPLQCLVDYMGHRLVAMLKLPINRSTIKVCPLFPSPFWAFENCHMFLLPPLHSHACGVFFFAD